jgi:hypothetical protein
MLVLNIFIYITGLFFRFWFNKSSAAATIAVHHNVCHYVEAEQKFPKFSDLQTSKMTAGFQKTVTQHASHRTVQI